MVSRRQFSLLEIYFTKLLVSFITNLAGRFEINYEKNASQCLFIDFHRKRSYGFNSVYHNNSAVMRSLFRIIIRTSKFDIVLGWVGIALDKT